MECPQDTRIWISELKGFIKSPCSSSSLRRNEYEYEDELKRSAYVLEATQITKEEDQLRCFKPSLVTIGPLHFDPCDRAYEKGHALKMEALRFIMKPVLADSNAPPWRLDGHQDWTVVFNEIANKIAGMEESIRSCYREGGQRIPSFLVDRHQFGWMILLDACFILVSLYIFQSNAVKEEINNNKSEWPCLQILTRGGEDATLRMILRDMFLLENQLPSSLLKEVAVMLHTPDATDLPFPLLDYFYGCRVIVWLYLHSIDWVPYCDAIHLPYIVRSRIVHLVSPERISQPTKPEQRPTGIFDGFLLPFKQGSKWLLENIEYIVNSKKVALILIILWLPVIVIIAMVMVIGLTPSFIIAYFWPNPILTAKGRVLPQEDLHYFPDEEGWNLVLRNVIALERCSPYMRKTVSNYVFLMGEILETPQDVEVLQAIGLVPKTVNSEREVQRWKSLAASAKVNGRPYADFDDPISVFRRELLSRKEQYSKLWMMWWTWKLWKVDLKKTYASSPWIALSTFAAIALLFMTEAQVICLFISCNKP